MDVIARNRVMSYIVTLDNCGYSFKFILGARISMRDY